MPYPENRPLRYTPQVRAMLPRVKAALLKAGLVVEHDVDRWDLSFSERSDGRRGVKIPNGLSRKPDALLCARGVPVFTYVHGDADARFCNLVHNIAPDLMAVVIHDDERGRPTQERGSVSLFVTLKSHFANDAAHARAERASCRRAQAYDGYAEALRAMLQAESDDERDQLADYVVQQYNLTLAKARADLQHQDREVRTQMLQALPVLRDRLERQGEQSWVSKLNTLLQIDRDFFQVMYHSTAADIPLGDQSLIPVVGKTGSDARVVHLVETVVTLLRAEAGAAEQAETVSLDTALGRAWHRAGTLAPAALSEETLAGNKGEPLGEILRRVIGVGGKEYRWLTDALDQTLQHAAHTAPIVSTADLVGRTLTTTYRDVVRTALAVCAWHRLGWAAEVGKGQRGEESWQHHRRVAPVLSQHLAQLAATVPPPSITGVGPVSHRPGARVRRR